MYQNKYNSTLYTANSLGRFFGNQYIYNYLLHTTIRTPPQVLKLLLSTTGKQVKQYILKYFDPDQMICIISNNKKHFRLD